MAEISGNKEAIELLKKRLNNPNCTDSNCIGSCGKCDSAINYAIRSIELLDQLFEFCEIKAVEPASYRYSPKIDGFNYIYRLLRDRCSR